ncbi:3-ketoacyl-ACP reductase [Prauserella marina]|uniref:SDR family mycofactocin-dependent oxidoreductase n=1 Tax=Prauserella marina TaxID=530584 RepID=A0A222VR60_9PSEU|nr:mycofactocin-coupled SDR family oxidoreductase [Prauserella marina]ASR36380.1 3-ketoacyl-ACP reductase [Prauserella marina]PWV77181.1 SDR family mycofactocin-dependent oxidoreductase [Prauserella marina]SDD06281.1 SDR family mycofactocin-dependent oxidoreductase [Prauserella marina]
MTGRVHGKVAFITGAARGQGRAHAVRLAREGADIIAVDICAPIRNVPYAAATREDLDETVKQVEALDRRIVSRVVDTRDADALKAAADEGVAELGKLDIVVANAGICIAAVWDKVTPEIFRDTIDINLVGTWNTVMATAPHLVTNGGGSIILTSSAAGLKGLPFLTPYVASKHGVTGMARSFANELAVHDIRVNSLHPTGVRTPMGGGEATAAFGPAMEKNPRVGGMFANSLPIETTEPEDQANAVLFLASDESRYVTALAMTVDAGNTQY